MRGGWTKIFVIGGIGCVAVIGIGAFLAFRFFSEVIGEVMNEETFEVSKPSAFDPFAALGEIQPKLGAGAKLVSIDASAVRPDGTMDLSAEFNPAPRAKYQFIEPTEEGKELMPPVGAGRGPDYSWAGPPFDHCGNEVCHHCAINNSHDCMRHSFTGINIAQAFANRNLYNKIPQREHNFDENDGDQNNNPFSLPSDPWERSEENRVEKITRRMKAQFRRGGFAACRKLRFPFVIIDGIERADHAENCEKPQGCRHSCASQSSAPA